MPGISCLAGEKFEDLRFQRCGDFYNGQEFDIEFAVFYFAYFASVFGYYQRKIQLRHAFTLPDGSYMLTKSFQFICETFVRHLGRKSGKFSDKKVCYNSQKI